MTMKRIAEADGGKVWMERVPQENMYILWSKTDGVLKTLGQASQPEGLPSWRVYKSFEPLATGQVECDAVCLLWHLATGER